MGCSQEGCTGVGAGQGRAREGRHSVRRNGKEDRKVSLGQRARKSRRRRHRGNLASGGKCRGAGCENAARWDAGDALAWGPGLRTAWDRWPLATEARLQHRWWGLKADSRFASLDSPSRSPTSSSSSRLRGERTPGVSTPRCSSCTSQEMLTPTLQTKLPTSSGRSPRRARRRPSSRSAALATSTRSSLTTRKRPRSSSRAFPRGSTSRMSASRARPLASK